MAANLDLADETTRTDGALDEGIVDIGYHYPSEEAELSISCSLNSDHFSVGDQLAGFVEVTNNGPTTDVDLYVAIVLPDGAIVSFLGDSFGVGIIPWLPGYELPGQFHYGPAWLFAISVPEGSATGNYLFAAALTRPGSLDYLSGPDLKSFIVE
jgi:hypothetical protein